MHNGIRFGAATALLPLLCSQSSVAQDGCGDIEFTDEITDRFPNAPNACLDIVERDGEEFAHFAARIVSVRGNNVEAQFRQPDGTYGQTVQFTPPPDARVRIQGRSYRYRELSRGQELDVYVPPDRWAMAVHQDPSADFATAPSVTIIALTAASQEEPRLAGALPSTASPLPWLLVLGAGFIGVGAAATAVAFRRKT